jgi:hypothetical protein
MSHPRYPLETNLITHRCGDIPALIPMDNRIPRSYLHALMTHINKAPFGLPSADSTVETWTKLPARKSAVVDHGTCA